MLKKLFLMMMCLTAPAFAKPVLTVYTYGSFNAEWGPGPKVKAAFESQCDCELKFVALGHGVGILNRLRLEGDKTEADIVLGLDNNLIQAASDTGLFMPSGVDVSALKVPGGWDDEVFVPYDYGWFAFVYDKERLKNPPQSLKELVESDEPWTILYADPRTSTPGQGFMLWMQKVYGDEVGDAWEKLAKKTVTVTKGSGEAYSLFLKGEADMSMYYSSSPAHSLMEENKDNYAAALFAEGHYLQVEVAARTRTGKQPELAKQFLEFMVSPAYQQLMPTVNKMYPVIDVEMPEAFVNLPKPEKSLQFTPQEVTQNRKQWIDVWQKAVSR